MIRSTEEAVDERVLDALGMSVQEESTYSWLLSYTAATVHEISQSQRISIRRTNRLLDTLESKGLVTVSPQRPRRYIAAAPDIAMEALIMRRQEDLQRARRLVARLRDRCAQRLAAPEQIVELLTSQEGKRQAYEHMQSTAQHDFVTLVRQPLLISRLDHSIKDDQRPQLQAQARGVRYRWIVDAEFLEMPGAIARLRENASIGLEIRVATRLPLKMSLADRNTAFIPLRVDQLDTPLLLVRSSALVDALHALFETLWERAAPITFDRSGAAHVGGPHCESHTAYDDLLSLMVMGLNDKAIAHELNISASTLNRRVVAMMKAADVRSRFQMGWLAAVWKAKADAVGL